MTKAAGRVSVLLLAAGLAACGGRDASEREGGDTPLAAFRGRQATEAARLGLPASFQAEFGMRFELVRAGTFWMGTPRGEPRAEDEVPHEVREFAAFYVAATEVPASAVAAWRGEPPPTSGADRPATGLSHEDAGRLAAWMSARDTTWWYRLPTEADWEWAVREAGPALRGADAGPWEWCRDRYGPYPEYYVTNPTGDDLGDERVLRGGPSARPGQRAHARPEAVRDDVGVRLAASLPYGKAGLGRVSLSFRTYEADEIGEPIETEEKTGFEVRIISVLDRLSSRQVGVELPWKTVPVRRTPFVWPVPPGRYYAQAQVPGSHVDRGVEIKIDGDRDEVVVRLPTPRRGVTLEKPQ